MVIENLLKGVPLQKGVQLVLTTDASALGWGGDPGLLVCSDEMILGGESSVIQLDGAVGGPEGCCAFSVPSRELSLGGSVGQSVDSGVHQQSGRYQVEVSEYDYLSDVSMGGVSSVVSDRSLHQGDRQLCGGFIKPLISIFPRDDFDFCCIYEHLRKVWHSLSGPLGL